MRLPVLQKPDRIEKLSNGEEMNDATNAPEIEGNG
jgi:hypothetical protein